MKTFMAKANETESKWYVVDATGKTLGRLASQVAAIIRGKHRPDFTPHVDAGDHVIVLNAEKIHLTGNKLRDKKYYRHSGYPGGIKVRTAGDMLNRNPDRLIKLAVWGMLPHNSLGRKMMRKVRVFKGNEHPHQAQTPENLELKY